MKSSRFFWFFFLLFPLLVNFSCRNLAQLSQIQSCDELKDYLAQASREAQRTWSYYYGDGGTMLFGLSGGTLNSAQPLAGAAEPAGENPDQYSTTNVQEAGVDEADFVKNDGEYIYLLNDKNLLIFSATPAEDTRELSRTRIAGRPSEMYVYNNRALIFSSLLSYDLDPALKEDFNGGNGYFPVLKITIFDLERKENPKLLKELYFQGWYQNSRRIENNVFIVGSLYPTSFSPDNFKLEDIIPTRVEKTQGEDGEVSRVAPLCDCEKFYRPEEPEGLGLIFVVSLNLFSVEDDPGITTLVATPGLVYASTDSLYLTSMKYNYGYGYSGGSLLSTLHKFNTSDESGQALYRASGQVEGTILNQFSMDEEKGFFRVATTEGYVSRDGNGTARNHVFILQELLGELVTAGEVRDLAPTEKIYSARFLGDKGYVVTFKKVDPLFTLDLSDPFHPQVKGELKIPGYSTYIHPLGDEYLLTIGKDADDQGTFAWYQGVQLSIFDVSDLSDPFLAQKEIIGGRGTESEALYNHKAFNYFAPKKILAIPITLYEGGSGGSSYGSLTFTGLQIYRVDIDGGFSLLGEVDHSDFYHESTYYSYSNDPAPRRSIVIGDYIYSISNLGMKVNEIADPAQEATSVSWAEE